MSKPEPQLSSTATPAHFEAWFERTRWADRLRVYPDLTYSIVRALHDAEFMEHDGMRLCDQFESDPGSAGIANCSAVFVGIPGVTDVAADGSVFADGGEL